MPNDFAENKETFFDYEKNRIFQSPKKTLFQK